MTISAAAQSVSDYVRVAPPGDWVIEDDIPETPFDLAEGLQLGYQLISYQSKVTSKAQDKLRYRRFVVDIQTTGGLEDYGTITVTFDPLYQTVDFHDISIWRNGTRIKLLDLEKFDIYRVETDRDKLLYNGDLQIGFSVPGLKVGDRIDYAYTVDGINPALLGSFYNRAFFEYTVPIRKLRDRLVLPSDTPYFTKKHNDAPEPEIKISNRSTYLDWYTENIKAQNFDEDVPEWFYIRPTYEVSGVEAWSDVGAHFSPYYDISERPDSTVQSIIDRIADESDDPKVRTRKALAFVQSNIRYLGIELGQGGYIPRPPELTLERKFGDCKDVTYLLMTILNGLGVEARPILVETDERGEFTRAQPGYSIFDHVLVRAIIDGEDYFLDATRGEQLGDLDRLDQGHFGKGLLLDGANSRVIEAEPADIEWLKDFVDEYDLVGNGDDIPMTIRLNYFGEEADSMKNWYEADGMKSVEKSLLDYFADFYPTVEQLKPVEFSEDVDAGSYSITAYYLIKDGWELSENGKQKEFWAIPYEVKADMPSFSGAKRSTPFSINYPVKTRQRIRFLVGKDWNMSLTPAEINTESFDYIREESYEGTLYEEVYSYVTKRDFIPAEGFAEIMNKINDARDAFGVTMTLPVDSGTASNDGAGSEWWDENFEAVFAVGFFLFALIALVVAVWRRDYDLAWRHDLILHPVGLKKFIFLSFWTFGLYQFYWFYKNWQWMKTVDNQEILPVVRTFFASFTNFVLFPRIKDIGDERDVSGYSWYGAFAIPLAFLYILFTVAERVIDKLEGVAEVWMLLSVVPFLIPIPVAMQVLKYNTAQPELVAKNSHFSVYTWLLVLLFTPIALLICLGFGTILFEALTF
jgi:hypothetical protein